MQRNNELALRVQEAERAYRLADAMLARRAVVKP
jgi:hypothetical protein